MIRSLTILIVVLALSAAPVMAQQGQVCDRSVTVDQPPGPVEIIPAMVGAQVLICGFILTTNATTSVTAQFSSGSVLLTGAMYASDEAPLPYNQPIRPTPLGGSVTLTVSGGHWAGVVSYKQ